MRQACGHRGCTAEFHERWATIPNLVTLVRTVGTVVLWGMALEQADERLLLAALLCYWVGDIADGLVARLTDTETRTGAVLDVLADRLCVCLVVVSYVTLHPVAALPAGVFLLQFVVLDAYLTLAFRNWSLLSPNYFGLVDVTIYRLNWSPPAKATNTGAVVLVVLLTGSMTAATLLAAAVFAVKAYSTARLSRLTVPWTPSGCAVRDVEPAAMPAPG
ncbi:MAG: CDP-alcohol phosphatidyltransferase family protein [Actinomycetota bacterium]|nr:CDP-alcohol phosphatidyltransferase family protein [Actinomycetota bacterium]